MLQLLKKNTQGFTFILFFVLIFLFIAETQTAFAANVLDGISLPSGYLKGDVGKFTTTPRATYTRGIYKKDQEFTIVVNRPKVEVCNNNNTKLGLSVTVTPTTRGYTSIQSVRTNSNSSYIYYTYKVNNVDPNHAYADFKLEWKYSGNLVFHKYKRKYNWRTRRFEYTNEFYNGQDHVVRLNNKVAARSYGRVRLQAKLNQAPLSLSPLTPQTFNTERTFTISGGSGSGAYSTQLISGPASKLSNTKYRANSGTGSYRIRVTKAEDSRYNARSQDFIIPLAKANQAPLVIGPTTDQVYNTVRTFTLAGGSGNGAFSSGLQEGPATKISTAQYRADSGTGSYRIRVIKAGDNNYNPTSADVTINLIKANQPALTIDKNTHVYDTMQTYTIGGGAGTGALSDSLVLGQDKVDRLSPLTYKALTGTGSYVIGVTKDGDNNYHPISQNFTITLQKAEQADLIISPLGPQDYLEIRPFTVSGGSGTGNYKDELVGGYGVKQDDFTYEAIGGSGLTYQVKFIKEADDNYLEKSEIKTIDLVSLNTGVAIEQFRSLLLSNPETKIDQLPLEFTGSLPNDFASNLTIGTIEIKDLQGSISVGAGSTDFIVSAPPVLNGTDIVPVTISLDTTNTNNTNIQPARFTLLLKDFGYLNNGFVISPTEIEVKYIVQGGLDVN